MSYVGRKGARAALIHADIPSNLNLLGDYVKIPSATTTERDALTPAVGMLLYNTTLGIMQQYNSVGWASIDSPPTVSSFTYPEGTALDPAGSTTETLVITGTNFSVGVTVAIDGTAPTATTRNSSTQITITGFPAKSAATYSNGLVVTNASGLVGSIDIIYDAIPAWTTAAGSLGSFEDGAYTNSSATTIRIVAAEGSDTIDYAQVSDATGDTVITSGVAGLTLGTTGVNAGYLTGTLSGDESSTYSFYAKAQDDENQFSAVRLFNIISRHPYPTGGTITTYTGFNIHTFLLAQTGNSFTPAVSLNADILVIAGGGQGGGNEGGGGGGAGGFKYWSQVPLTAQAYTVTVGDGGDSSTGGDTGEVGGNSQFGSLSVSTGGGGGGPHALAPVSGMNGGSGGGATGRGGHDGGDGLANQGNDGGTCCPSSGPGGALDTGGGGGGASAAGTNGADNGPGGNGGAGYTEGATVYNWQAGTGTVTFPALFTAGTGSNLIYAGGGAGGSETGTAGTAGIGGGGAAAGNGTDNFGGGGGGNQGSGTGSQGNGGSGIVIIRYAI